MSKSYAYDIFDIKASLDALMKLSYHVHCRVCGSVILADGNCGSSYYYNPLYTKKICQACVLKKVANEEVK